MNEACENTCESAIQGPNKGSLGEIEGDEIVEVEVIAGGYKYCNIINMKLKSEKFLQISKYLDVSKYGITPRLEYKIGSWTKFYPDGDTEEDCPGQQLFDFINYS